MNESDKIFCMLLLLGLIAIYGLLAIPLMFFMNSSFISYYIGLLVITLVASLGLLARNCRLYMKHNIEDNHRG